MYNRYIPRSDGSYQKNRMQEQAPSNPRRETPPAPEPVRHQSPAPPSSPPKTEPMLSFLRKLLPKGFDTGDLIVVLLILLMAGECEEERNNAMLTLAIYFFL